MMFGDALVGVFHALYLPFLMLVMSSSISQWVKLPDYAALTAGVAATGVAAMSMFWLAAITMPYAYIHKLLILGVFLTIIGRGVWLIMHGRIVKALLPPLILYGLSIYILLSIAHGGSAISPYAELVRSRFFEGLSNDNALPFMFLLQFNDGHLAPQLAGGWLVSDKPPLQTACSMLAPWYILSENSVDSLSVSYQTFAIGLQMLFVLASWAICRMFDLSRLASVGAMILVFFMPVTFMNGVYVWPLLFGSAITGFFFTAHFGYLRMLENSDYSAPSPVLMGGLAGALSGLVLLAHDAQFYALLGIIFVSLYWVRQFGLRYFLVFFGIGLVVFLPWLVFQDQFAPPGHRMMKNYLTGVSSPDARGVLEAIWQSYSDIGFYEFISRRVSNVVIIYLHFWDSISQMWSLIGAIWSGNSVEQLESIKALRASYFYFVSPSMGLLGFSLFILPFGLFYRSYRKYIIVLLACIGVWAILSFSRHSTLVFQGSAFPQLLAVTLFYTASVRWFWGLIPVYAAHVILTLCVFLPAVGNDSYYSMQRKDFGMKRPTISKSAVIEHKGFDGVDLHRTNFHDTDTFGSFTEEERHWNRGYIRFSGKRGDSFYYRNGLDNKQQFVRIIDGNTVILLKITIEPATWARIDLVGDWLPDEFIIEITDEGTSVGEWSAVALLSE